MMTASGKGKRYPSEKTEFKDAATGATIWQMTNAPANHHNIYMTKTCFTADGKTIVFLSKRTGYWNLFKADVESGEMVQLTDFDTDIHTYSIGLLPDRRAYGVVGHRRLFTVDIDTLEETVLFDSGELPMSSAYHSPDGELIVTKVKDGEVFRIILVHTDGSGVRTVLETNHPLGVGYLLITPDKKHIIHHKKERQLWCVDIDGKNNRPLYGHESDIWITHPTCFGNDKVLFAEFPNAIKTVRITDGQVETIAEFNGWHMGIHPNGKKLVCDTTNPDTGIWEVDIATGERRLLCKSDSHFPKVETRDGPWLDLWAHPHPSYSPDGKMVIFNSCRDGKYTQLYIALVPE